MSHSKSSAKPNLRCVGCAYYRPPVQKKPTDKLSDHRDIPVHVLGQWIKDGSFKKIGVHALHYKSASVGKIVEARQAADGSVIVQFEIDRSSPMGEMVAQKVESKELKGLSIGHRYKPKPDGSREYILDELTICGEGARNDTVIISVGEATNEGAMSCHTEAKSAVPMSTEDSVSVMCSKVEQYFREDRLKELQRAGLVYNGK